MSKQAIFLDRDGTIIEDVGYVVRPDQVRLLPGVIEALARLQKAGYLIVVISNQSGVARGLMSEDDLTAVHARMKGLLGAEGVELDGAYYCPFLDGPDAKVEAYRRDSELRKPKAGMLLQAAREMDIDLARSWMIGDAPRDVEAGRRAGCRSILLSANDEENDGDSVDGAFLASDLLEAVAIVERTKSEIPQSASMAKDSLGERESGTPDTVNTWLERIHKTLEEKRRGDRQQDFSVLRMFGTLLQMFAIVVAIWGLPALFANDYAPAMARFSLATFLQLASLSTLVLDRLR